MSLQQHIAAKKAEEPPSCYSGGTNSGRALVEFRPDARKRVGFPWAQLCHYTLEANAGNPDAPERLTLAFSTADVVIVGARLGKLADLASEQNLIWAAALEGRYANLLVKQPWIGSIAIARIDKSGDTPS